MQLFGKRFLAVPRFIWVILMSIVTLALSLGGRNVFEAILENLLPLLGYWTICFAIVLLSEHFIFRPRLGGYDLDGWQDPKRTPLGLAGVGTLLSAIALSFLGMNQTWVSWSLLPFEILKTCLPQKKTNIALLTYNSTRDLLLNLSVTMVGMSATMLLLFGRFWHIRFVGQSRSSMSVAEAQRGFWMRRVVF